MTPNDSTRCACGHAKEQHVYHDGPCRPGFACPRGCTEFTPLAPSEPVGAVDLAAAEKWAKALFSAKDGVIPRMPAREAAIVCHAYLALREQVARETFAAGMMEQMNAKLRGQVATLTADNEFCRAELEAVRIENLGVRAQNKALARATPAEGEAVAWAITYLGEVMLDSIYKSRESADAECASRAKMYPRTSHDRSVIPLYPTPPRSPATVTEAQVERVDAAITAHMNQHGPIATLALARVALTAALGGCDAE